MTSSQNPVQMYQAENGALEIQVDQNQETIWLTQAQITQLFQIDQSQSKKGICKVATIKEVAAIGYNLNPYRYVGMVKSTITPRKL